MGLSQLLSPSKLKAAQASIQAGGDGVRDGVAMILVAAAEYADSEGADGVNGSTVRWLVGTAERCLWIPPDCLVPCSCLLVNTSTCTTAVTEQTGLMWLRIKFVAQHRTTVVTPPIISARLFRTL